MKEAEGYPLPKEEIERMTTSFNESILAKVRLSLQTMNGDEPICFGSNPSYQDRAENCCHECKFKHRCLG